MTRRQVSENKIVLRNKPITRSQTTAKTRLSTDSNVSKSRKRRGRAKKGEFAVGEILQHNTVGNLMKENPEGFSHLEKYGDDTMAFLVHWDGFDSDDDSWEPLLNLCQTGMLNDYFRQHLIPTHGRMIGLDKNGEEIISFEFVEPSDTDKDYGIYLKSFAMAVDEEEELSSRKKSKTPVREPKINAKKARRMPKKSFDPKIDGLGPDAILPQEFDDDCYADLFYF